MRVAVLAVAILTSAYAVLQLVERFRTANARTAKLDPFNVFVVLTMLNFWLFGCLVWMFGGSAMNGKVAGEQHFLGDHGQYTAVSFGVWLFSFAHGWITFVSFAAMFLGLVIGAVTGRLNLPSNGDDLHPRGRGTV